MCYSFYDTLTRTTNQPMKQTRALGMFAGVSLPSLFMLLVSFDAPLVAGTDVFLFSLL